MASAGSNNHPDFALCDPKTLALAEILRQRYCAGPRAPLRLLAVGCGSGIEVAGLARHLSAEATGIDIAPNFDPRAASVVDLREGDATQMEFEDATFDFVYSFHALEHIPDYRAALREMRRVMRPGAGYAIGTPNRLRLVGYLGSTGVPLVTKLQWNMADWSAMLRGRFRNEFGAHAGYAPSELRDELARIFTHVESITLDYYLSLYRKQRRMVSTLHRTGMSRWLFPAVYFCGVR
jgi:SAM-dependent methyltransferase